VEVVRSPVRLDILANVAQDTMLYRREAREFEGGDEEAGAIGFGLKERRPEWKVQSGRHASPSLRAGQE